MVSHRLENYLRTYRKHSSLTQEEVAFLLGCKKGIFVSRYEKRRRLPPLETALTYEAVFGVPIAELFAGLRQKIENHVAKRRLELKSKLQAKVGKGSAAQITAHKLRWLGDRETA